MNLAILKEIKLYGLAIVLLLFAGCKKEKVAPVKEQVAVTEYYPNSGNKGTLVTVLGTGFGRNIDEVSASFADVKAEVLSVTPTAVVLQAPSDGQNGAIVMNIGEESFPIGQYTYQELSVQRISPANGGAGTLIRISGAGFSSLSGPAEVFINGMPATIKSAKDTLLVAQVPVGASSGPVKVIVNGQEAAGQRFKFQSVTAIKPLTGGKGTRVRITGSGFEEEVAGNYVDFNGKAALVEEAAEDYLVVVAPEGVSTGPLAVTINEQKITGPVFTVVPSPVIRNVSPLSGPAGTIMTISGTTFSTIADENKVTINGVNVPLTTLTATEITLALPGGTGSGKIILSVNDQVAVGPDFKDQNLGISKLSPENGLPGTQVTITGTGFSTTGEQNIVTFNGTPATVLSATETSLVVIAPEGFTSGPLKVVTNSLTAMAPIDFNYAGVVTLAGGPGTTELTLDPSRTSALAVDGSGNVFVMEIGKHRIMKITPQGAVSLFAGSPDGLSGSTNGTGSEASFSFATSSGMTIDQQDNLYISDYGSQSIRKVTPQGVVSTFATNLGFMAKITIDEQGSLYVVATSNLSATKIDKNGLKTSISLLYGSKADAKPVSFAGVFYSVTGQANYINSTDIASGQSVSRWVGGNSGFADGIGQAAMFTVINSMASDGKGNMLVADNNNFAIRNVHIPTQEVTTLAKFAAVTGFKDGALAEAQFGSLSDLTVDKNGNIYVLDNVNNAIRKIVLK